MPSFLRAKEAKTLELFLYGDVGSDVGGGMSAAGLAALLAAHPDVTLIQLRISSFGGSANEGITIYNLLSRHSARIEVDIDGMCASAASVIAMAGDKVRIASNGMFLPHEAGGVPPGRGTAAEHDKAAEMLRTLNEGVIGIYAARTKLPADQLASIMAADKPMAADEAVRLGFADEVVEPVAIAAHATSYRMAGEQAAPQVPAQPQEPAKPGEGSAQGDFNALGDALAKLTGIDRSEILSLLIDGQDALAEMVKQAMGTKVEPGQMASAAMGASMRMTFTEARMNADERAKLTAENEALRAQIAKDKNEKVRAHVASLVATGYCRAGEQDVEDAVFAFSNAPERAARMYAQKLVPVGEPPVVTPPVAGGPVLKFEDLSPSEQLRVKGMTWMTQQDAIKKVVSRRKEN